MRRAGRGDPRRVRRLTSQIGRQGVISADDSASLVDYSQIDSLLEAAGRDGVVAILDAFWRSTDDLSKRLQMEVQECSFTEAARTSHAVKGSAANVGAQTLAAAARDIESCCKAGDADGALKALNRLLDAYRSTRIALTERVAAFG